MDSAKAAISYLKKKKMLADAFNLQLRMDPKAKNADHECTRRISAEFMVKKVKLPAESKVPRARTHAWAMAAIPERERLYCEKSSARTSTRLGKGEIPSKSKERRAAKRGKRRATSAGTWNQDSSRVTTGGDEERELTRKKALLAAAAFEKWVAETARVQITRAHHMQPDHD